MDQHQPPQVYDKTLNPFYQLFENPDESSDYSYEAAQKHNKSSVKDDHEATDDKKTCLSDETNQEDVESSHNMNQTSQEDDHEPAADDKKTCLSIGTSQEDVESSDNMNLISHPCRKHDETSQEDDHEPADDKKTYQKHDEISQEDDHEPADDKTHQKHDESSDYSDSENMSETSQEDDHEPSSSDDDDSENMSETSQEDDDDELYASFESVYRCYPLSYIEKTHLECGDKIIMPAEALERLLDTEIDYPMLFEIQNQTTGKVSHCGVYEFTGEEGSVFLPNWMMENLQLQEGDSVNMKNASLEKGTYMKLQPHTMDFMGIRDPKAVLEETFRSFSCLTTEDTIMISHESKNFYINIVETKPSNAVSIIDADCEVDFALALDYKEPEKPAPKNALAAKAQAPEVPIEEPKFIPFTGVGRRIHGEPLAASGVQNELPSVAADGRSKANELKFTPQKRPGKVVLGSDEIQPQNKSKGLAKEDVKAETSKKEQSFQPFTGKKYSLTG